MFGWEILLLFQSLPALLTTLSTIFIHHISSSLLTFLFFIPHNTALPKTSDLFPNALLYLPCATFGGLRAHFVYPSDHMPLWSLTNSYVVFPIIWRSPCKNGHTQEYLINKLTLKWLSTSSFNKTLTIECTGAQQLNCSYTGSDSFSASILSVCGIVTVCQQGYDSLTLV